jgi:surfeit locus 1 family protein
VRRFPIGLTLAALIALAVLVGLGAWQIQRLAWKQALLARIAALDGAPAKPLVGVLEDARRGRDVAYRRVSTLCAPLPGPPPMAFRYALRDGQVGWRLLTPCPLKSGPYDAILLDRGLVTRLDGLMTPVPARFPDPVAVVGVLRAPGRRSWLSPAAPPGADGVTVVQSLDASAVASLLGGLSPKAPAPYILTVESESPAPPGLRPAALPEDIPNNHLVYAITWFGLAGTLVFVYGAMLLGRMRRP